MKTYVRQERWELHRTGTQSKKAEFARVDPVYLSNVQCDKRFSELEQ